MGVHVFPILNPPPTPSHPSGLSQYTSFECPVSCFELELVIYFTYDNIHVSILFSQINPPLPSPTESKSLVLYLCLFWYLAYRVIVTIFLISMLCCAKLLQSCLTLCDPLDCSPPGSSVHGILQAEYCHWVAISFSIYMR